MRRKMKSMEVIEVEAYYKQAQFGENPGVKREWNKANQSTNSMFRWSFK